MAVINSHVKNRRHNMAQIIAVTGCTTGIAHTHLAAEALKKTAESMGHYLRVERHSAQGVLDQLSDEEIRNADVVIIASDIYVDSMRFDGKPMIASQVNLAIRKTRSVIESALAEIGEQVEPQRASVTSPEPVQEVPDSDEQTKFIVAVTSCPTGIAHTFMAAKALQNGAAELGYTIKVETQGSVGAKNLLTDDDIHQADAVVVAADAYVDTARFAGKRLLQTSTKAALHDGAQVIRDALNQAVADGTTLAESVKDLKKARSSNRTGPYKHLMTGVSYMLPLVVAGGLLIALGFAIGGINAGDEANHGSFAWALLQIGGGTAFKLYVPILAAFIAYSIADRPGLTSGIIGGMLATTIGAGFLGGIAAGFLAGYVTKLMNDWIKLPENLSGLKPVLILPVLSALVVGLVMIFVIGPPVKVAMDGLAAWLMGLQHSSALVLGVLLGAMMAFDMGGPVNKAAYTFAVGLLASNVYGPMAAVMAAGMTPPLGLALAAMLFKSRFTKDERDASKAAAVLGIAFISEGAIPYAARDPFRVIPCLVLGSAVTGAISMVCGVELVVPHGGIFVLPIPNAVNHLLAYSIAIVAGTVVTTIALFFLKRPLTR
jgi:PTS system fructose-specific IIC component